MIDVSDLGAWDMLQYLRAFVDIVEDLGLVFSIQ